MREDCADLTEITIDAVHELILEGPLAVNDAIARWWSERSAIAQQPTRGRIGPEGGQGRGPKGDDKEC